MAKRFMTILRDKNVDALNAWNPTPTAQNLLTVRPRICEQSCLLRVSGRPRKALH